jgi:hypothetical protein
MIINRKTSLGLFGLGLSLSLIFIGCSAQNPAQQDVPYQPLNLADVKGELTGDDPKAMALELFGVKKSMEGNFSQDLEVIEPQAFEKIVILTQMNLPDDSIKGIRYRLQFQFEQSEGKWRLNQVGRQQLCYRNDKPSDWTIEPCP